MKFLEIAAAGAILALVGSPARAETLVLLNEGAGKSQLTDIAAMYADETGTKIEFVELPYAGLYERISSDLRSERPSFDLAAVDAVWLTDFAAGLEPLDEMFTSEVKADLFPALVAEPYIDGHFVGMPAWTNVEILFYRKDLFADATQQANFKSKYGRDLKVPTTWDEYREVSEFFTQDTDGDGTTDLYGTDVVGNTDAEWLATVLQAGAANLIMDASGAPVINDAEHKAALDYYVGLTPYAPPGASQVGWGEAYNLFDQGNTAIMRFWASAFRGFAPTSKVAGKVGAATMIAGPGGIGAIPGAWYLAIPKGGEKATLARDFIQYVYDHNSVAIEKASFGVGARISAFEQFKDQPGYEYITPMIETLNGDATRPRPANRKWQQIVDSVIIPLLQASVEPGADTKSLLDDAQEQIERIVE